jgi:hypothetical protein
MTAGLKTYERDATNVLQDFVTKIEAPPPPPPVIYHYTNDAGLKGNLESGPAMVFRYIRPK